MVFKSKFPDVTPDARYGDLVSNFFWCQLDAHGARELFLDHASGRRWTGAQIKQTSAKLARQLVARGLKPEADCVLLHTHCDYNQLVALAVLFAGGAVCAGYPLDPEHEHAYMLDVVRPAFVFAAGRLVPELVRLRREDPQCDYKIVVMDDDTLAECDLSRLAQDTQLTLLHHHLLGTEAPPGPALPVQVNPQRPAFILVTSGSTGRPKPTSRSQRNSLYVCHSLQGAAELWDLSASSVVSAHLSLDYGSGIFLLKHCLAHGYRSIIMDGFSLETMLAAIETHRITDLVLGSALVHTLLSSDQVGPALCAEAEPALVARLQSRLGSLRNIMAVGAQICSGALVREFMARLPECSVRQTFGMTESGFQCLVPRELALHGRQPDPAAVGLAMPNVELKLVDRQLSAACDRAHELVEIGEPERRGELYVRGPTVSPGYLGAQFRKQVRDNFLADGFYRSGDVCAMGADGMLRVFGRYNEVLFLTDGGKMLPGEAERALLAHPAVREAAVVGVPHPSLAHFHQARAYVVLHEGVAVREDNGETNGRSQVVGDGGGGDGRGAVSQKAIFDFVAARLSRAKHLTGGIKFVPELPKISVGKVDKLALKKADGY